MKLGGRIAIYILIVALECGYFWAVNPDTDLSRESLRLDIEYNRERVHHIAEMNRLNWISKCMTKTKDGDACEAAYDAKEAREETRKRRELLDAEYAALKAAKP